MPVGDGHKSGVWFPGTLLQAIDFWAFDAYKRALGGGGPASTLAAAGLAGVTSWVTLYPLEVCCSLLHMAGL